MLSNQVQPIIKRKKKVIAAAHHGGAWKVAYADFVTAMMAFFLLMWLLNATTEDQRKGIADYFNPSIPISRISGGGADALNGSSVFSDKEMAKDGVGSMDIKYFDGNSKVDVADLGLAYSATDTDEAVKTEIDGMTANSVESLKQKLAGEAAQISDHIMMKMTAEGLVIELVESDGAPLFASGNAMASPLLEDLLVLVAGSFGKIGNDIKLVGHTDAKPYRSGTGYSNWELSTDRANVSRRLLIDAGFPAEQITEVSGKAATDPLIAEDIYAAQNRRISITILQ
ncbi:flagellar motor protein MotB [Aquisalinus flavus]|uniref:flagellar motor protein MotB n=1 Tax=Aquisalinus flavus TaxID=1526572 RepID=UPI001E3A90CC|nr:flagellar motor protein MotB [Aquisalinus flavus]